MYNKAKNGSYYTRSAVLFYILCASSAQADVHVEPGANPQVLAQTRISAPLAQHSNTTRKHAENLTWPDPARFSTTLRLTLNGLAPMALDMELGFKAHSSVALTLTSLSDFAPDQTSHLTNDGPTDRDWITTASIPVTATPAGARLSQTIEQELPLFGAHRIRFGKINSGARISGLIRKAATSGSSAICINQCASLADRLSLTGADITEQLQHVSATVNKLVTYRTDEENHGRLDQWSTPNETLSRSSGDCEDYAILKMALLSHLGVPMSAMEVVVVKDTNRRLFHAVLSVALEGRSVILDNMTDAVEADTAKRSYAPLFSISGNANYIFGYKGGKPSLMASVKNIAAIAPGAGF